MKKQKNYIYRIKDIDTGLYYSKRDYRIPSPLVEISGYQYKYTTKNRWGKEFINYLFFNSTTL